jgi:hypothetical protein
MDVDEMVEERFEEEVVGAGVGWCNSRNRTLVPARKQLMWEFVGGYVSMCFKYLYSLL